MNNFRHLFIKTFFKNHYENQIFEEYNKRHLLVHIIHIKC